MDRDYMLEYLLSLDDSFIDMEDDWEVHVRAHQIPSTRQRPHGLRYSLTLHNTLGERVLGYDNAHFARDGKRQGTFDHIHRGSRVRHYQYVDAEALLADFLKDVDQHIEEHRSKK